MDNAKFLAAIEDALRAEPGSISLAHRFDELESWDSIGALSVIAVIDEQYGVTLDAGSLMACQTIGDLASLVAGDAAKAA